MRKVALILAILSILTLSAVFFPHYVDKPVKDGKGPLSVYVDPKFAAPEYHSPLDWWQIYHMDLVNRGDLVQKDCLYCHNVETSCNNCHDYVGAKKIVN